MTLTEDSDKERKTIGVFVSRLGRAWGPEFIVGIREAAEAKNLNVIVFVGGKPTAILTPGQMQPSYGLYDIARRERLAGLIVSGDLGYELSLREVKPFINNYAHLPMIVNALQVDGIPNITGDNLRGMRTAISHLFDVHGYHKIAFIRGPEHQVEAEQRFLAYKQELKARQIPWDENLVLPGDFSVESGRAAVRILLDQRRVAVDAIVAANDRMAIGAFEALQLRGIQVPGNIALTGFDDIREARAMGVPLTTVLQSFYEMGKQAVDLLLRRMTGEILPDNIVLPSQLVVRWSCGCLPASVQKSVPEPGRVIHAGPLKDPRESVILKILQAVGISDDASQSDAIRSASGLAWDSLVNSVKNGKSHELFLPRIETLIAVLSQHTEDTSVWQNAISALRQQAMKTFIDRNLFLQAENLFQQARIMVGELSQRHQALLRLRQDLQEEVLQAFSFSMAPAMTLDEIGAAIDRHFPQMGIGRMYVMLYASMTMPQSVLMPPSENYFLLMKYDENGIQIPSEQPKWPVGSMVPDIKVLENQPYAAVVMPLILAQNRFGFIWLEMKTRDWDVYVRVRNLVSSALLRTMLVDQRALMQKQVEHLLQESQMREMQLAIATETAERTAEENARLYTHEQERRKDAETLSKVARNLSSLLKMDEMPQQILKQLSALLPYDRAALLLGDPVAGVHIMAHSGFPTGRTEAELFDQIDIGGAYEHMVQDAEPLLIPDLTDLERWRPADWLPVNQSWLGVPLLSKEKVIGMLALTRRQALAFSHDDLLLVTTFGTQTAISLENARLYDEVTRFNELLEGMVAQRVDELKVAYDKLEKLDKNKTSFIQVTAHELRTPLTVMKGYLGMLKGIPSIQADESMKMAVDGVLKGTDRLHMIVNSMLDVARLEGQTITPRLETVVILLVFQHVQKEYKDDLAARNISMIYDDGISALPFVQADSELLQKALDAIFVNAIKYTPDGGRINVGGRLVNDEELGSCLEIYIRDTGIGIDPANHLVIFEKLFQLGKVELHSSGRTKFKGGGPGLGLAIAAGIVKAHNGKIWVHSSGYDEEKLPGSTFYIRLPMTRKT